MKTNPITTLPDGVKAIAWDSWPRYPDWLTERQLAEQKLVPGGPAVGAVWYNNKYLRRKGHDGHYLLLYDRTQAKPKVVDEKRLQAAARARETARQNATCAACQRYTRRKIRRADHLCDHCADEQDAIKQARTWLASDAVIVDTETTGLRESDEVIALAVVDMAGRVLLDTLIKPIAPIDENGVAIAINGISNAMVADAPMFPDVWDWLRAIAAPRGTLLAYNVEFDRGMLARNRRKHELPPIWEGSDWQCVMIWYACAYSYDRQRWVSLGSALSDQGAWGADIAVEAGPHTAVGDCLRTLALIKAVAAKVAPLERKEANR